jgi:hypothetical protein
MVLAIWGLTSGTQAIPTPINGAISFSGSAIIDGDNFVTATEFLDFLEVTVGSPLSVNGDYVGTSGATVDVTPFTWSPTTASTPIDPLWVFTHGANTYSFTLSVLHSDYVSPTSILLSGVGTAHIAGPGVEKLDTSGIWNFSAQTLGESTFTFSSTTTVPVSVPDGGATVALLGAAIFLLGLRKRG